MPMKSGKDSKGNYVQWGDSGTRYYYKAGDKASRARAIARMNKQRKAIEASKHSK